MHWDGVGRAAAVASLNAMGQSEQTTAGDHSDSAPIPACDSRPAVTVAQESTPSQGGRVSEPRTLWYVETLFSYINQLMERMQTRCNYLILANSVAVVAFLTMIGALLADRGRDAHLLGRSHSLLIALLPSALFLGSIVVAVTAFLPRVYANDIELNHEFIATLSREGYRRLVEQKVDRLKLTDFVDEIHVLARILNDRSRRVDLSARLFIAGVTSMTIVVACIVA
jgi:hypothetical protein